MSEGVPISFFESVFLGIVQGVTEFLPISSSGHLVILQTLLGKDEPQLLFDVMLHVGTLAAIFIVFRKDIADMARTVFGIAGGAERNERTGVWMPIAIVVGCVPTALIGIVFSEQFERMFASMTAAGAGLTITGLVLISTVWRNKASAEAEYDSPKRIGIGQALLIGTAQGLAIFPGVSRSGATIAAALLLGVERETAARFSFLLAIPAILGALAFELRNFFPAGHSASVAAGMTAMLSGAIVAAITGIIALKFLLGIVRKGKISLFAYYCWALGVLAISYGIFGG